MEMFNFKAHYWTNSSQQVKSREIGFELSSSDHKIDVKNTSEWIDIFVPLPSGFLKTERFCLKKTGIDYWSVHSIDVPKDNSIHIELRPFNKCLTFDVFLKHGSKPSKIDYDFTWSVPNVTTCINSTFLQHVCREFNNADADLKVIPNYAQNCTADEHFIYNRTKSVKSCKLHHDPYRLFVSNTDIPSGRSFLGKT